MPKAILTSERLDNFKNPMWVAHPLGMAERAEVEAALVLLEERGRTARRDRIIAMLMRLSVQWPPKDAQAFGMVLSDMADAFMTFSEPQVAIACVQWQKTGKWFPKIAEMLELLEPMRVDDKTHLRRARVLLGRERPFPWEVPVMKESDFAPPGTLRPAAEIIAEHKAKYGR